MKIVINQKFVIVVLLIAILILASYIGFDKINGYIINQAYDAYSTGYQKGISDTIQKLVSESENCGPVPVNIGNETKNFIDISCLQIQGE